MKTTYTIKNFAKRVVMALVTIFLVGNVWGADPTITITRSSFSAASGNYGTYTWSAGGISGSATMRPENATNIQFNSSNRKIWNTTPVPGKIKSITMTTGNEGSNRAWIVRGSSSAFDSSSESSSGTAIGSSTTVTTSGTTFTVTGGYDFQYFFCYLNASNASYIASIVITYEEATSTHTVTINKNQNSWGTVTASSVSDVEDNTSISADGNVLTVGATTVTATPHAQDADYNYAFSSWSGIPAGGKVTADVTVTANFTRTARTLTNYRTSCVACEAPTSVTITGTNKYLGGQTISLTATPTGGTGTPSYQWQKKISGVWTNLANGGSISGATSDNLQISSCDHNNSGGYRCIVSTGEGCETKSHADGTDGYGVHVFSLHGKYTTDGGYSDHEITWTSGTTGTKTLHLSAKKTYLFKVWSNNGYYYGHGANANEDFMFQPTTWDCGVDNREMRLFTTVEGDYTFTVNIEHGLDGTPYVNVQVGYPSMTHPNSGYVYVQKFGWRPYLHYWYNNENVLSAWGSDPQLNSDQYTTICGTDYWCVPVIDYYCNFIAKDAAGDPGNTTGDQHTNSPHPGQRLYNNGSWNWGTFTTYSITYAGNGNTGGSMTSETDICPNADKALTPNAFSKADHTFQHWTADVDVKIGGATVTAGNAISDGATIQDIQSNIALTAQWRHVPVITVSETARAFGDRAVGGSYTMTFTVSGTYLQSDLSIARTSGSTYFTVDKATVTQTDGTAPTTTITVTYAPAAAGSHSATLTISSTNATSKTVALSGTGKWEVTWNNNGATSTTLVANSTKPTFPSTPGSCDGTSTTFIGWATAPWTGKIASLADKTVHTSNSTMSAVTANGTTYYAVFASGSLYYGRLTSSDLSTLAAGSKLVIVAVDQGYVLKNDLTCSSSVPTETAGVITPDDDLIWELAGSSGSWNIKSGSNILGTQYNSCAGSGNGVILAFNSNHQAYTIASSSHSTNEFYIKDNSCDNGVLTKASKYDDFRIVTISSYSSAASAALKLYTQKGSYSDYMTTCCDKQVSLSATVTGSVGGTVAFSPVSPIATCSATAAERKTTVTVTPATGYKLTGWTKAVSGISLPDSTSAISTSSGNAEVQTNTYTFAQNANGSMSVTATFTMMVDHYIDRLHNKTGYTGDGMVKNTVGYTIPNPGDASAPADDSCIEAHYKFIGWIAEEYVDTDGTLLDASKLFTASGTKNPSDTNFLAVWAKEE